MKANNDNGYIVVETVGTFVPFLLLVISILSLVNIVTLQARVHYALTQAAKTLSMYSYVLEAMGAADKLVTLDENAGRVSDGINAVLKGIGSLSSDITDNGSENHMYNGNEDRVGDADSMITSIISYAVNESRNELCESFIRPLVSGYLANGEMTGEEYLRSVRVIDFEFIDTVVIDRNGNIKLSVKYEVEYTFGILPLPFGPSLSIKQTVVTKAWLGGSGEGYR